MLTTRSNEKIKRFYQTFDAVEIPLKLMFDSEFSPSEKAFFATLVKSCQFTIMSKLVGEELGNDELLFTDFTNKEFERLLGGVSLRSLHRHLRRLRQRGFIRLEFSNKPRPNSRTIYLTPKAIRYFFDQEVGSSSTMAEDGYVY